MAYSWEHLEPREKSAILDAIGNADACPPPRVVEISWQDRCNIDCFFCSTAEMRAGNFELPRGRLISLFEEMRELGVRSVRLTGGGEPLFRKDAAELIGELGLRRIRVNDVTTNGVLLTEPVLRALYAAGCDEIHVSLNTAEPGSYAAMMQTAEKNFERVVENVRRAAAIKKETGSRCEIKLQFLIYRDNYRQIPRMHRLFRESGADSFWFNGLFAVGRPFPAMSEAEIDEMLRLYQGVVSEDRGECLTGFSFWERPIAGRIAQATRAALNRGPLPRRLRERGRRFLAGRESRKLSSLHEFCLIGWYSTAINANGDVVPCCILQDRKSAVLGNIRDRRLREVWEGPAYRRFRAELREIMARRGAGLPSGACVVEEVCVGKGLCPNRSFYWADDAPFRRKFHQMVEEMPAPDTPGRSRAPRTLLPNYPGDDAPARESRRPAGVIP